MLLSPECVGASSFFAQELWKFFSLWFQGLTWYSCPVGGHYSIRACWWGEVARWFLSFHCCYQFLHWLLGTGIPWQKNISSSTSIMHAVKAWSTFGLTQRTQDHDNSTLSLLWFRSHLQKDQKTNCWPPKFMTTHSPFRHHWQLAI